MTRGDRIVIAIVAVVAILAWPASLLAAGGFAQHRVVVITGPGPSVSVPLAADRHIEARGLRGVVTVVVEDGAVAVADAECPDHLCVRQGSITQGAIVCVPNGVTIRVGGDADALDAHVR